MIAADAREKDLSLADLRETVVLVEAVRSDCHVRAKRDEADDEAEHDLLEGARHEEDRQPDQGELTEALEDLKPVGSQLVRADDLGEKGRKHRERFGVRRILCRLRLMIGKRRRGEGGH